MSLDIEQVKVKVLQLLKNKDKAGLQMELAQVLEQALANPQARPDLVRALNFWKDKGPDLGVEVGQLLEDLCRDRENVLLGELQATENRLATLAQQYPRRQRWLEKLILINDIQKLQADPRHQTQALIEQIRLEREQVRQEIAQLEQKIRVRVTGLREQL